MESEITRSLGSPLSTRIMFFISFCFFSIASISYCSRWIKSSSTGLSFSLHKRRTWPGQGWSSQNRDFAEIGSCAKTVHSLLSDNCLFAFWWSHAIIGNTCSGPLYLLFGYRTCSSEGRFSPNAVTCSDTLDHSVPTIYAVSSSITFSDPHRCLWPLCSCWIEWLLLTHLFLFFVMSGELQGHFDIGVPPVPTGGVPHTGERQPPLVQLRSQEGLREAPRAGEQFVLNMTGHRAFESVCGVPLEVLDPSLKGNLAMLSLSSERISLMPISWSLVIPATIFSCRQVSSGCMSYSSKSYH